MDQTLVHGATFPLLVTATGEKMGKKAQGALWLDPARCKHYDFNQYLGNVHEVNVKKLLGLLNFLPMDGIPTLSGIDGGASQAVSSTTSSVADKHA